MFATFAIADLTPQRLTAEEVTEVIKIAWKQMAGEEDKTKDEVTLFELREWCKLDLGRRGLLTKMFSGNVRGTVAKEAQADSKLKKLGERKFDGGRASIRFERALKKNGKTQMAAKREKEAISKLQKSKHGGNAAALSVDLREEARMRKRKLNAVGRQPEGGPPRLGPPPGRARAVPPPTCYTLSARSPSPRPSTVWESPLRRCAPPGN